MYLHLFFSICMKSFAVSIAKYWEKNNNNTYACENHFSFYLIYVWREHIAHGVFVYTQHEIKFYFTNFFFKFFFALFPSNCLQTLMCFFFLSSFSYTKCREFFTPFWRVRNISGETYKKWNSFVAFCALLINCLCMHFVCIRFFISCGFFTWIFHIYNSLVRNARHSRGPFGTATFHDFKSSRTKNWNEQNGFSHQILWWSH